MMEIEVAAMDSQTVGNRTYGGTPVQTPRVVSDTAHLEIQPSEIEAAAQQKERFELTSEIIAKMLKAAGRLPEGQYNKLRGHLDAFAKPKSKSNVQPVDYCELLASHPDLRPQLIHGICRVGEIVNVIAAPKIGKSFLAVCLAWCVALGRSWLGFETVAGRVLIIDNELHEETLADRIDKVANKMMIAAEDRPGRIHTLSLRGHELIDLDSIAEFIYSIPPGAYSAVVFDALYRALPDGCNENENGAMTRLYNTLDRYASQLHAAIFVVHHTSKGDQSGKGVTDVGSGAGAISRAADTHLTIRPHVEDGHAVLEAVTRSFKSPDPLTIKFDYPAWEATSKPAEVRKQAGQADQSQKDVETDAEVLEALTQSSMPLSNAELRKVTGFGESRVQRALNRLRKSERVDCKEIERNKKNALRFFPI